MKKRKTSTRNHRGLQGVTLCISIALVLILLGMVVLSVFTARNLSAYVKENFTITMMLSEDMTTPEAQSLCKEIKKAPYISSLTFISKEQALKEQTKAMGSDPSEFLGVNPFVGSIELQLKSDYANTDSLKWISTKLKQNPKVNEITYPRDLMDSVNKNLKKINLVLIILAVLLTCVSFTLINNSVKLGIYARRFNIHTMKLVGASWNFIRGPFIRKSVLIGVIAAVIATAILGGGILALYNYEPAVLTVITVPVMVITGVSMLLFGVIITMLCAYFSVNKFLKMRAGDLYKI